MPKSKKKRTIEIGGKAVRKPTDHQMIWWRKQERKIREARMFARRVIWYFGDGSISPIFDADIAIRDMALALLGHPMTGGAGILTKTWKKIFRGTGKSRSITYYLNGKKINIPWGQQQ